MVLRLIYLLALIGVGMLHADDRPQATADSSRKPASEAPRRINPARVVPKVQFDEQKVRDWLFVKMRLIKVTRRPERITEVDPDDVWNHHSEYGRVITGTENILGSIASSGVTTFSPDDGKLKSHQYLADTGDGTFELRETEPTIWRSRLKFGSSSMTEDGGIKLSGVDVIATTILRRKRVPGLPFDISYAGEPTLSTERFAGTIEVPKGTTTIHRTKIVEGVAEPDSPGNFWLLVRTRTVHASAVELRMLMDEEKLNR